MFDVLVTESFSAWTEGLRDPLARAQVGRRIRRAQDGNLGDHRSVGEGLFEMRIDSGPGYRIYLLFSDPQVIVLLNGGDKSTQRADILAAKAQARGATVTQAYDLKPFALDAYLRTGDEVAAYLKVVLEEQDSLEFVKALRDVSRATGLAEFAARLGRPPQALAEALSAPSVDPVLMLELAAALGWRLAPTDTAHAEAA